MIENPIQDYYNKKRNVHDDVHHDIESSSTFHPQVIVCGMSLERFPKFIQIIICIIGIFSFYLFFGITQEYLFTKFENFKFGFFATFYQFLTLTLLSGYQLYQENKNKMMRHSEKRKIPIKLYLILASLTVGGMGLGNQALHYLNYPTKVLFKSCKLLAVMIFGFWILKKKYNRYDYIASILVTLGLICVVSANTSTGVSKDLELKGIILMIGSLSCDAFIGNLQEKILKEKNASGNELIFYSNAIGSIYLIFICMAFDQFTTAISYCIRHPLTFVLMTIYSSCGYFGVQFVHGLTKLQGIVVTVTATSVRKVITIFLSFILFPKPFSFQYIISIILVFSGVFVKMSSARLKKA